MELSDRNKKIIEVIGFDLDGTLYPETPEIRNRVREKIYEKISELCKIPEEKSKELFEKNYSESYSGSESIKKILNTYDIIIKGKDIIQEALEEADVLDLLEENLNLSIMLEKLSQTKKIDLITGSNKNIALKKLSKLGIAPNLFEYIFTFEDGSKTTGEKYLKWLGKRNLRPEQHLCVGDNRKQDIDVPNSLGIKTCIVGEYQNADFQIKNILELEELVRQR